MVCCQQVSKIDLVTLNFTQGTLGRFHNEASIWNAPWTRTAGLWYQKRPLCQLSHNQDPKEEERFSLRIERIKCACHTWPLSASNFQLELDIDLIRWRQNVGYRTGLWRRQWRRIPRHVWHYTNCGLRPKARDLGVTLVVFCSCCSIVVLVQLLFLFNCCSCSCFSIVVLVVQLLFFLCSYLADPERGRSEGINLKEMQQKVQIVMLKIVCAAVA